jgi:hypothetical protein
MRTYVAALLAIAVVASTVVTALAHSSPSDRRTVAHVDDGQDTQPTKPGPTNPQGPAS